MPPLGLVACKSLSWGGSSFGRDVDTPSGHEEEEEEVDFSEHEADFSSHRCQLVIFWAVTKDAVT